MEEIPESRTKLRTVVLYAMLFAVFAGVIILAYFATFNRPITTVILVRHAEKKIEPANPDPDLSDVGQERAQTLAHLLKDAGVTSIYATQYKRTQETAEPLATSLHLQVNRIDASNTAELIHQITVNNRGGTVVVVGHNNTVPATIKALGGGEYPVIPETDYDNMFVVTIYRSGKAKTVQLKYGSGTKASGDQQMMQKP